MSAVGHEDPFPPLWLDVRCVIRHGTFAETNGNGRHAPIAVPRRIADRNPARSPDVRRFRVFTNVIF